MNIQTRIKIGTAVLMWLAAVSLPIDSIYLVSVDSHLLLPGALVELLHKAATENLFEVCIELLFSGVLTAGGLTVQRRASSGERS